MRQTKQHFILEAPVTVEQRTGFRIGPSGGVESIKDELVVVVIANGEGNNSPVTEVQNGAELDFTHFGTHIVFEPGHIG